MKNEYSDNLEDAIGQCVVYGVDKFGDEKIYHFGIDGFFGWKNNIHSDVWVKGEFVKWRPALEPFIESN